MYKYSVASWNSCRKINIDPRCTVYLHFLYLRHILATLHFNENAKRKPKQTKHGKTCMHIAYPKFKLGDEVVREVLVPPTYGEFKLAIMPQELKLPFINCF